MRQTDPQAARAAFPESDSAPGTVLLVGDESAWPRELVASLERQGNRADWLRDLAHAPALMSDGHVRALLVVARPLGGHELLSLRRCREISPRTAIVVMTATPTQPDLKRAFESGATAFLSWPASPEALRQALASGEVPTSARPGATRP